jgi:hypothetical protein
MIVGVLELLVGLFEAFNLKDKRRVLRSVKDRLHNTFNVSVAEVGENDNLRAAQLGVAMVANERRFVESALSKVVDFVRRAPQITLIDYTIETF